MYSSFLCSYWTSSFLSVSKLTHCVASDASVGSTKYSAAISQCTCNWNCGKTSNEARFSTMKTNLLSEQPLSDAECIIKTVLHSFRNPLVTRKKNRTTLQQGLCVKIHGCNMSVKHVHTATQAPHPHSRTLLTKMSKTLIYWSFMSKGKERKNHSVVREIRILIRR